MPSLSLGRGQSPHCSRPPLIPLQQEGAGLPHSCWWGWTWLLLMSQVGWGESHYPLEQMKVLASYVAFYDMTLAGGWSALLQPHEG